MKKFLAFVLLIAIAAGGWYVWSERTSVEDVELAPATSRPNPEDATFGFEDGPITLKDGRSSEPVAPGSAILTETVLDAENLAYGDVNGDKKNDAVFLLVQESGGSGIFIYIAAYVSGNVSHKGSNVVFIGDRISPQSLSINPNGIITFSYLERAPGEAMATVPTVPRTKELVYRSGELQVR
jgi:hypothetical protein